MPEETKIYVPQQKVRRGVAGYKGANVVVVGENGETVAKKPSKGKK